MANSDTLADQQLKLKVRDRIINYLSENMEICETLEQAESVIQNRLEEIKVVADTVVADAGYAYGVDVGLSKRYFPEKNYGDMTFPRGYYQALTVEIGSGEGRNWWCVLFPNLCFSDAVTATVSDISKELLEEELGQDTYQYLLQGENVQIRFKILEIIADLFSE